MVHRWLTPTVLMAAAALLCAPATGEDWPRYYGPNLDGISNEAGWNSDWSANKPTIAWTRQVGSGSNSVSVSDGVLVTSGFDNGKNTIYLLDPATGETLWTHSHAASDRNGMGRSYPGGPQTTATFDGDRFYLLGQFGKLICVDAKARKILWQRDLREDFGGKPERWGYAGSPLVDGDRLIVDVGGKRGSTMALNKMTGETIWATGDDKIGYASPMIAEVDGRRTLLIHKAEALVAMDPANGKELWRHPWKVSYGVSAPLPIVRGQHVFITTGYNSGAELLKVDGNRVSSVYRLRSVSSQMASPIFFNGYIYAVSGNSGRGELVCIDFKTGEEQWRDGSFGTGSFMIADGKIIGLTERGELRVGPASPEGPKWTGRMKVLDGICWVVPVLSHGRIYCKNNDGKLVCVDVSR